MVKRCLAILAVTSFCGLAIFGFLGIADHGFNTCLMRAVHGGVCPGNALSSLNFHLDALKIFSSANLLNFAVSVLGALLLGLALTVFGNSDLSRNAVILKNYFQKLSFVRNYSFEQISRWLIRHETSPTF